MILPCRIHRARNRNALIRSLSRSCSPLALLAPATAKQWVKNQSAGGVRKQAGLGLAASYSNSDHGRRGRGLRRQRYPTAERRRLRYSRRENVVLTYDRPGERTQFFVVGVGRFTQYFDVSGQNETAGNVTLSLTHNFSTSAFLLRQRLRHLPEPSRISQSNVGPQNVRAHYFDTVDIFSLTYHWLFAISSVTSYTFERVQYFSSSNGNSQNGVQNTLAQNRIQNTFGEEFQFSLTSRTILVGEYRFEAIDYDTAPTNSTTNSVLAGVNHNLTEHLIVHVRGGESFRSLENEGNMASPYFEGSLSYVSSNHSLNWTTSYGYRIAHGDRRDDHQDVAHRSEPDLQSNFAAQFDHWRLLSS